MATTTNPTAALQATARDWLSIPSVADGGRGITPAPLIERSAAPLVVANVVESDPLDRMTAIGKAHIYAMGPQRRAGQWVRHGKDRFRFVSDPEPYRNPPVEPTLAKVYDKADVEAMIAAIKIGYQTMGPADVAIMDQNNTSAVAEAIADIVSVGLSVEVSCDGEAVMVKVYQQLARSRSTMVVGFANIDGARSVSPEMVVQAFTDAAWEGSVAIRDAEQDR